MSGTADGWGSGGTRSTDPRTIITPDAFSVAPELLGLPLARPWRRAVAILVDLVLVAILANAQAVFFAFAAGFFVFWLATRGLGGAPSAGRRVARVTLGCLGALALTIGALAVGAALFVDSDRIISELETRGGEEIAMSAATVRDLVNLATAPDSAAAAEAADRAVERMRTRDVQPEEIRRALEDLQSEMDEEATTGRALQALDAALDRAAPSETVDTLPADASIERLLAAYVDARARNDSAAIARLGPRLGAALASAELEEMQERARRQEDRTENLRDELAQTEQALEDERNRGILATVYALLDDVGLGLGWAGLYFTFFLGRWEGRTPGKRLLGIRVVRLDGRPLGYWVSFERYGGYAASLFTGLEGFARLIWDPNRQALEDRLAGTVVLRDTPEARRRVKELHERTAGAA